MSTTCIFSEFLEKKNRTYIFQQAGQKKYFLSLSLSLSIYLSLSLWEKTRTCTGYRTCLIIFLWNKTLKKLSALNMDRVCTKSRDGARYSNLTSDQWFVTSNVVLHSHFSGNFMYTGSFRVVMQDSTACFCDKACHLGFTRPKPVDHGYVFSMAVGTQWRIQEF